MAKLFPGKGAHLVLNEEILSYIQRALEDINDMYDDAQHDESPSLVIDGLLDEEATHQCDWTEENDSFGRKAYASKQYKEGELRITVVLTKRGELKLDIREWFEGNN
jgi:hypothetical protein